VTVLEGQSGVQLIVGGPASQSQRHPDLGGGYLSGVTESKGSSTSSIVTVMAAMAA
jgi:hypothetical protein